MQRSMLLATAMLLLVSSACIKRIEKITVLPDGSARLESQFEGDPGDVHHGDAAPTEESGWQVEDRTELDKEGKEKLYRLGRRELGAGQTWPDSYAPPGSELDRIALQFPTSLTLEHADGGTYYHFKRVYTARPFNYVHYFKQRTENSDEYKEITQKEADDLTEDDYRTLVERLVEMDRLQTAAFIQKAADQLSGMIPQFALLNIHRAALQVYDAGNLIEEAAQMLISDDSDSFEDLEQQVRDQQIIAMRQALDETDLAAGVIEQFMETYELLREAFEITEDLSDEEWVVQLQMPGIVIAHNSRQGEIAQDVRDAVDKIETTTDHKWQFNYDMKRRTSDETDHVMEVQIEPGKQSSGEHLKLRFSRSAAKVNWAFDGKALQDRDVVLLATSFLPDEKAEDDE